LSTSIIEPGTRLAGRYRLEDRVSESGGSTLWKAIDEILARPVAIRTFAPDFARAGEVVTAARAASRLTDPRLTQVFDADDSGERAYVVSEWVVGENLEDLLHNGPMEPERAAALLAEAAEAIAAAHRAGLSHLRLTPANLIWSTGGTVKVTGLAVEAALTGGAAPPGEPDPATADARGLGRLLYAAVTAHWPGDSPAISGAVLAADAPAGDGGAAGSPDAAATRLPAAPRAGGQVYAPRQVLGGVPGALDSLICRALGIHLRNGQPPFSGPEEVAAALAQVPRTPLPLFMGMRSGPPPAVTPRPARAEPPRETRTRPAPPRSAQPTWSVGAPPPAGGPAGPTTSFAPRRAHRHRTNEGQVNKPLVGLAAVLAVVAVAVGGWQLSRLGGGGERQQPPSTSAAAPRQGTALRVAAATGFDPAPGDGDEKSDRAPLAIDSKNATAWTTDGYNSEQFGQLKNGVGLLLDMGRQVRVTEVKVSLPGPTGSVLQLRAGDSSDDIGAMSPVARSTDSSGTITFKPSGAVRARYLLLWFTRLAPDDGRYRGKISDVVVRGSAG
jgi:serine/threonine protein kinase